MKTPSLWLLLVLLLGSAATAQTTTKTYSGTSDIFANPERGFSIDRQAYHAGEALNASDMQSTRAAGYSLVRRVYVLKDFKDFAISQAYLDMVAADFRTARTAGLKLVVRFTENWDAGADAPKSRVLSHIDQLKNVLQANPDVIAYVEAGFIGRWGEWHDSTNGLDNTTDRGDILKHLLDAVPAERTVALRYPNHKKQIFNHYSPLTPDEAFTNTDRARVGAHNDYFLSDEADGGTYTYGNADEREKERNYLHQDNRYVVQGGESGVDDPNLNRCAKSLAELKRLRYSHLNAYYEPNVLSGWQNDGCMDDVKRRLGYRFRLVTATLDNQVAAGATFKASVKVKNDGWASCYNRRGVEVILRNKATGSQLVAKSTALKGDQDPRFWLADEEHTFSVAYTLPAGTAVGQYQVLLNLHDPHGSLHDKPGYAIRLANQNTWESNTGYNSLQHEVTVTAATSAAVFSGTYKLVVRSSDKVLDVDGSSTADEAKVQQWEDNGTNAQRWLIADVDDGYHKLTCVASGKALNVAGSGTANGTRVQQYTDNGAAAQRWKIEPTSDGYYKRTAECSGKVLAISGGESATASGDPVHQWDFGGGTDQQWKLELVTGTSLRVASVAAVATLPAPVGNEPALSVYPNPSHGGQVTLALTARTAQRTTVQVRDGQGRLVRLFTVPLRPGTTRFPLPGRLRAGTYFLTTKLDGQAVRFTLQVG